ncbi:hypothetical protein MVEN_01762800 [Mycena venus]|uniref:Uncharacterized protein n=1 Tax=Mycena venus TaxID=2733690 RepID=A0A8H6XKI6_9AGAR|nr:hypothetical protein MVEN_01762800 [Mycena venus]
MACTAVTIACGASSPPEPESELDMLSQTQDPPPHAALLPFAGGGSPPFSTAKLKSLASSTSAAAVPDLLSTALVALKESADAFPPLKSAVGGVLAVTDIAQRAKHSKSDARDIALRTQAILDTIAAAVPDPLAISVPMLQSIERFTMLLDDIRLSMEAIALSSGVSRIVRLNRNERVLGDIKAQLEDAYRDFLAACALRVEAQQTELATRQAYLADQLAQTHMDVGKLAVTTDAIGPELSHVLFYSRLSVFFGRAPQRRPLISRSASQKLMFGEAPNQGNPLSLIFQNLLVPYWNHGSNTHPPPCSQMFLSIFINKL